MVGPRNETGEHMTRKLIVLALGVLTALAMVAAPAAAHPHEKAAKGGIGPALDGPGAIAHNGIECAVDNNPNLTVSLADALGLECPADRNGG